MEPAVDTMAALIAQIGTLLTDALGWVEDVLEWIPTQPLIVFFIALGLAGAMIRWARRLIHVN